MCLISFYCYSLDVCFVSERQKGTGFSWEGKREGTGRSGGIGDSNKDIFIAFKNIQVQYHKGKPNKTHKKIRARRRKIDGGKGKGRKGWGKRLIKEGKQERIPSNYTSKKLIILKTSDMTC